MSGRVLFAAAILLAVPPSAALAGGNTAAFLKLGSGARATGLGGAYTAVAGDINAVSFNPAGLACLKRSEAGFTRAELVESVSYNSLGYARPAAGGNIAVAVNYLGQSSIEGRGANREVTGSFQASDTAVNLAYARSLTARAGLGLNFKYITSRIADESAAGWAVDAGWQYRTPVKGLGLGFAVQNLGPEMKFLEEGSSLPLTARAGAGYALPCNILLSLDVSREVNERKNVVSFGGEYAVFSSVFLRAGYLNDTAAAGGSGLTGAGALKAGFGFKLRDFSLDYAAAPFGDAGKAQRISLGARFQ
ncbi:MAG TPA: PorV/PorQ family protein [Elusimicrobiales bacterium]|nr:PorV/PorQ family protein [Elusimicrobiales bacterium]